MRYRHTMFPSEHMKERYAYVFRIPRHRWEDNIRMDFKGAGSEGCGSEEGPMRGTSEHNNGLPVSMKCGKFRE
jgi:hypothetical protein